MIDVPRPWRRLWIGGLLGLVPAGISLFLAAGQMHANRSASATDPESRSPADGQTPALVCLGGVDVRSGIVSLSPTASGRIVEVSVQDNEDVKPAQVLLRLDDRIARTQLREAEAWLRAAESQLADARKAPRQHQLLLAQQKAAVAAARHDLAAARLAASQKKKLFESKQMSHDEAAAAAEQVKKLEAVEEAEAAKQEGLELRDPAQEVARAEAEVRARRAVFDRANDALEEYTLKSPAAGTILRVRVSPGEVVGPRATQAAILFCPAGRRVVRAEVDQEYAPRVTVGQRAVIEDAAASGGPTWTGRVVRIADLFTQRRITAPDATPIQDVRTLECLVELDRDQPALRIGQRVRVKLYASAP